jgi:hypothetical protein
MWDCEYHVLICAKNFIFCTNYSSFTDTELETFRSALGGARYLLTAARIFR